MKRLINRLSNAKNFGQTFILNHSERLVRLANFAEIICIVYDLEHYKVIVLAANIGLSYLNKKLKS